MYDMLKKLHMQNKTEVDEMTCEKDGIYGIPSPEKDFQS
jgi:hypothetical protein